MAPIPNANFVWIRKSTGKSRICDFQSGPRGGKVVDSCLGIRCIVCMLLDAKP